MYRKKRLRKAGKWDGEIGLFLPLPDEIVAQYPGGKDGNDGRPHVTFFYIGEIPKDRYGELLDVLRSELQEWRGPVQANIGQLDYFEQPERDGRVAYLTVEFSRDFANLRERLYARLLDEDFEVEEINPRVYFPHTTLAYLDGSDSVYRGTLPQGSWEFDTIEVWNMEKDPIELPLGVGYRVARLVRRYRRAKYKSKKKDENGNVIYEYSEGQVANRDKKKAEKVKALDKKIGEVRKKAKRDLKAQDDKKRLTALAVLLIDETYERVGNKDSAEEGHFGVTGWQGSHIKFEGKKATISYVGKSGVKHTKEVTTPVLVEALKSACEGKSGSDCLLSFGEGSTVSPKDVNDYLADFEVTSKDLRGFHANRVMSEVLGRMESEEGDLPEEKKEREKALKKRFDKALKETAKAVGHTEATLKTNYLVPGFEREFLRGGSVPKGIPKSATKSDAEREEDEAEKRMLRKSPKKKPPRKDLRERKLKEDDDDVSSNDEDMSLRDRKARRNPQYSSYISTHINEGYGLWSSRLKRGSGQNPRKIKNLGGMMARSGSLQVVTRDLDRIASLLEKNYRRLGIPREMAMKAAYQFDVLSDHIERGPGSDKGDVARQITAALDRMASWFEENHSDWGIPPAVARDAAYRFDLLSDHLERTAADFDAESIGEVQKGPLEVAEADDDLPGEFTQEEFSSVREVAESKQASHGYNLYL